MSEKYTSLEHHIRSIMESASVPAGTAERRKVSIVGRPDDPPPTSPKSTLGKQGQIKTKIIDEAEKEKVQPTEIILNPEIKNVNVDTLDIDTKNKKLKKVVKEGIISSLAKAASKPVTKLAGSVGVDAASMAAQGVLGDPVGTAALASQYTKIGKNGVASGALSSLVPKKANKDENEPARQERYKNIVKDAVKEDAATAVASKAAGKLGGKLLPGIGAAYGAADAYDRYKKGDYTGAAMAGASGIASLVPGVGTAASLALDAANLKRDYDAGEFSDKPASTAAEPAKTEPPVSSQQPVNKPVVNKTKPVIKKRGI